MSQAYNHQLMMSPTVNRWCLLRITPFLWGGGGAVPSYTNITRRKWPKKHWPTRPRTTALPAWQIARAFCHDLPAS
jgi:hypothetical protein